MSEYVRIDGFSKTETYVETYRPGFPLRRAVVVPFKYVVGRHAFVYFVDVVKVKHAVVLGLAPTSLDAK